MPTGAPPRARRRYLPPPVWRFAPRRLLHDVVTLTLMLGVLTMLSVAAAAGPLYAEAVSDAAVRLALESVPAGAAAKTAPVVRLNGGIDPETRQWTDMLRSLEEIPGVGPARVTTQTISTELHPTVFFDPVGPVLGGDAGSAPVRLFGVDDPTDSTGRRDPGAGCRRGRLAARAGGAVDRGRRGRRGPGAAVRAARRGRDDHAGARHLRRAARRPHPAVATGRAAVGRPRGRGLPLRRPGADPAGPPRRRGPRHDRRPGEAGRRPAAVVGPGPAERRRPLASPSSTAPRMP